MRDEQIMSNELTHSIRYTVTIDDLIALNVFYARTSPTMRAMQNKYFIIALPVVFLITYGIAVLLPDHRGATLQIFTATLSTLVVAAYLKYYFKRGYITRLRHLVRKLYAEGKNPGAVGEHVLKVGAGGLMVTSEFKESRYAWGVLTRLESEPGYTYFFTGATSAFIVPHNSITEGSFPALLEQINTHYQPDATLNARKATSITL